MSESQTALAELTRLQERLARIETPRDAKEEIAWVDAMLKIAKALGLDRDKQNALAEHRLRVMRSGGESLVNRGMRAGRPSGNSPRLGEFGIDYHQSSTWQTIYEDIAQEVFEAHIEQKKAAEDGELTVTGVLKLATKPKPVPGPNSFTLEGGLMRFAAADVVELPTPKIVALILRVLFPDALTALDVTYGSGAFWDGSAHVSVRAHDADPTRAPDGVMDFRNLDYAEDSFDVVLFDPPHLADAGELSLMRERFGTYGLADLKLAMCQGAAEAWRVARLGIVVKVTDHVHAGDGPWFRRQTGWVIEAVGQEPYDVVHQVRSTPLVDPKWQQQLSAYNNGSTYLIFRKGDQDHIKRASVE
jgi:hypothetical protein